MQKQIGKFVSQKPLVYGIMGVVAVFGCMVLLPEAAIAAPEITNPLGTTDPATIVARIIKVVLGIIGVVALLVIVYGGFEMLISAGNEDRIQRGRDAILWAVLGLFIVFGSYGIIRLVFMALSGSTDGL